MSGPIVFWPNRKSALGMRAISRTPRAHRMPAWSTSPPIANDDKENGMDAQIEIDTRFVLRGLVLAVTDQGDDAQKKTIAQLDAIDDARLVATAKEALFNLKRVKQSYDGLLGDVRNMKKELERLRTEYAVEERALAEAKKAVQERDDIAAKYKELQKQLDPEKRQLEIMYAIDEATAASKDEIANLKRELAQRASEVNELRASKKKLREAMDRLAEKA